MIFQTAWIAAPLMILVTLLGLRISGLRLSGVARSKDEAALASFARWQRAHGNAIEHVPLVLLLLFMIEMLHASRVTVLALGVPFVAARLLHAYGTIRPHRWSKFIGAGITYAVELGVGGLLLFEMLRTLR
jgi:uncharacterized membrane protein YecN with MAPEG domain